MLVVALLRTVLDYDNGGMVVGGYLLRHRSSSSYPPSEVT